MWLRNIRKSSPSTCNQRLCAIHAFFDYVMVEEPQFMEQCIQIHNIPRMVSSAPPAKYLTPDALRCLLATPDITTPKGRRHLVLLTVLYDTAARVSELADIRMRDVRLDSPAAIALFEKTVQENFVNGAMQKASFQTMRKAAHWIEEYLSTGQVSQQKLRKYNFACAPPEFENLLSQYQLYMDNENYLKKGSRQFYLSSVRTFFRTIATLGIYRYAEITLPDVTRCLAKISETFPLGIFNLTGSMRSFARFMAEKHPELPDISPALVFSAAKRRRVYVGYTHEDAQKIFSAINRSSTMGMRDYAMIMLAYTTGLRGCDIVNLKFDSIDWDACELRLVQEKTNIPVSLPLDTKTGNAIADYILHARPKCKSEYIFLRVLRPYTKIGSMWTVIAKYAHIALGKDRKMNGPHAFRRGMGRQLLEANIPAPLICDILGHSSSVSLRQYTASSLEKLKVCAGTISAIPIAQEALL